MAWTPSRAELLSMFLLVRHDNLVSSRAPISTGWEELARRSHDAALLGTLWQLWGAPSPADASRTSTLDEAIDTATALGCRDFDYSSSRLRTPSGAVELRSPVAVAIGDWLISRTDRNESLFCRIAGGAVTLDRLSPQDARAVIHKHAYILDADVP